MLMSNVQASFRILANNKQTPTEVCVTLNKIMINYFITERFTSFFYEIINIEQWKLLYSNAGHLPPIAIRNSGEILHLPNGGLLIGLIPLLLTSYLRSH